MLARKQKPIRTTLGDLINAWYEAALDEVGDEDAARHIAAVLVSDFLVNSQRPH
ncbi:MAG: hypothetical protein JW841_06400 [Deltaproteobacteria bacterium]|nr:hypothetical protein [Deltaproteobacteria bacterium]